MDAISLHQRGITNAVASLGTALTEEQGRLIRKYSEQVVFSYDSDGAGQEAIKRGLEVLESQGCDARVLQMEGAKDPDEYIIKYGSGRFNLLVENAISLVEFKIKVLKQKYNLDNANDKIKFLKEITRILAKIDNNIEREIYIDKISKQYNISKEAIYGEVNKTLYKESNSNSSANILSRQAVNKEEVKSDISDSQLKRENVIIYLLINHLEESFEEIIKNISTNDFKNELNRRIFEIILENINAGQDKIVSSISNIEDENLQAHVSTIMVSDYEITSVKKCIEDIIVTYNKDKLISRKMEIIKELENPNLSKEQAYGLEQELNNIIIELAKNK